MMHDFSPRVAALTAEPSRDDAGDVPRLARVERTRVEMKAQGTAAACTLSVGADKVELLGECLRSRKIDRVVVAGCGDSWFIGMGVRLAIECMLGIPLEPVQALDFAVYGEAVLTEHTLIIGISASGKIKRLHRL